MENSGDNEEVENIAFDKNPAHLIAACHTPKRVFLEQHIIKAGLWTYSYHIMGSNPTSV